MNIMTIEFDPFGVYKIKDTLFYDDTNINFLLTIIEKPQ